jgi:serine protease Do
LPAPGGGVAAPHSFADLAASADPAVVFVRTLQERTGSRGRKRIVGEGLGSAFVYDPGGLILTNNHVIENAADIRVIFGNTKEMKATIVGRDPPTDIALLRVEAQGLPYVELGDSERLRVGDWVVAIGNPFGLSHTVSAGIVSAKGRTGQDVPGLGDRTGYYNFLQTDASINPGNSGGPLLDMSGRVVGINTAIRARANNIGFAVPVSMVKQLLPQLLKDGRVRRSAIQASVGPVTPEDAARLALPSRTGALVLKIIPGGPADRAGLREDDVIVAIDGRPMEGPEQLRWDVSLAGIGKSITLRVKRGQRTFDVRATLNELPESSEPPAPEPEPFGFP